MAQIEAIRRAMSAQPFRPFSIRLVDGRIYQVPHPDWLAIPPVQRPREIFYFVAEGSGSDNFETHWIDLALISEVIVPSGQAAAPARDSGGS
jgi:hypothetical protein